MSSRYNLPFADVGSGIKPSSGAKLFFFETDGVTPKDTFSDQLPTPTPNANPVIADSNGVFGDIFIVGDYKNTLTDNVNVQIFGGVPITESGSEAVSATIARLNPDTVAIASADTSLLVNDVLNIEEYSTGNSGGAEWDVIAGTGTANGVNKVQHDTLQLTLVRRETKNISFNLAWVFDDAHDSAGPSGTLKSLFDSRGYKYALAIPGANLLSGGSKLDFNEAKEMQEAGFEIINHGFTGDPPSGTAYGVLKFIGEAQTTWSQFNKIGIHSVAYQTPNSVLNDAYKEVASGMFSYAFTVAASINPMQRGVGRYDLFRLGIEAFTLQQCVDAVDDLIRFGGTSIMFAHDIIFEDVNYDKIVAVLDRINALGFGDNVTGVSEAVRNVVDFKEPLLDWYLGDLISNNPNDYVEAVGGTITSITISNVSDLNITITNAAPTRIEKDITLPDGMLKGDLINFNSTLRSISGSFGVDSAIGIELKDSGDSILASKEIEGIALNTNTARYPVNIAFTTGAVTATVYMIIDADSAGAVALMRNPLLRFGPDINPETFIPSGGDTIGVLTDAIPTQTITFGSTKTVTLNDAADNGRYSISSNKLTMTANWTGSIHGSVLGGAQATNGGWVGWSVAGVTGGGLGGTVSISPLSVNPDGPVGCAVLASDFKIGQTFTLKANAFLSDFGISSATSRVTSF